LLSRDRKIVLIKIRGNFMIQIQRKNLNLRLMMNWKLKIIRRRSVRELMSLPRDRV